MGIWFAAPIDQFPDYDKVTTTPTSTNANASFPAANLLKYDPTQVFMATATSCVITWDLGAIKTFDVISLLYTNLTDAATWTLELSTDNSVWNTVKAAGSPALAHYVAGQTTQNKRQMLRRNNVLYDSPSTLSYRYIRITPNSQVAGLFPSIGRLFVGTKFKPATGWQYGSSIDFTDLSQKDRTDRAAAILSPQFPLVVGNVKMDFLSQAEMEDYIFEFNYWRGAAREILACLDDQNIKWLQKNLIYGTISEGRRISFEAFNAHSVQWVIESLAA